MIDILSYFSNTTGIYAFMNSPWGWPTAESIHFLGLCVLIGTVGVFDFRMLGIGQGIEYADLHKLVKFGVAGYLLNVITGTMFLTTAPDQYIYNPAFQTKMLFMLLAGLNMLWFYATTSQQVKATNGEIAVSNRAKIIAAVSLLSWSIIIICGRLITYFRPPYHWCLWC
ncbi:MAG: hypothetical protein OXU66_04260 [Gammaproteobacteria bacterium]|nr:hypothetical protein [Gammaproteobacteria bacterium]MDD9894303.1 hypothetical protein [Gammaproteobacteria bacterium]MDD9958134.1 hypothetical protein [Gammaproteobacteria bacterium]